MEPRYRRRLWIFLLGLTLISVATFCVVILESWTYWPLVNNYFRTFTGVPINFMMIFVPISLVALGYISVRIRYYRRNPANLGEKKPKIHVFFTLIALFFGLTNLIFVSLISGDEILSGFRFYELFFVIICGMVAIILSLQVYRASRKEKGMSLSTIKRWQLSRRSVFALAWLLCIGGFTIVLFFQPSNVITGPLPTKPQLVAHRGGSHLGPENTIETAKTACNFGVIGWEIDVQISADGVPFMMHDNCLLRTTNVEEVFPTRAWDKADTFTWAELQQLNAGSWFVRDDPFNTIAEKIIGEDRIASYQIAKIPSLAQAVNFTRDQNLTLNVDWKGPDANHSFHNQYFSICYDIIANGNVSSGVWIMDLDPADYASLPPPSSKIILMESSYIIYPSVETFRATGKQMINAPDNILNMFYRSYQEAGITLNVYGINSKYRFSQVWCLGVDFVTTDSPQLFYQMNSPEFYIIAEDYYMIITPFSLVGILASCWLLNKS